MIKKLIRKIYNKIPSVNVAMLHHVCDDKPIVDSIILSVDNFNKFLSINQFISIKDLKNFKKNNGKYIITLDDGLDNLYYNTYKILSKINVPFLAFISADLIDKPGYITKEQLIEMSNSDVCTIGSHGATHQHLLTLNNEQVYYEIVSSKQTLEKIIGKIVEYFAYPFGEFSKRELKLVKKAKYKMAFSVVPRKANALSLKGNGKYKIPRFNLSNEIMNKDNNV